MDRRGRVTTECFARCDTHKIDIITSQVKVVLIRSLLIHVHATSRIRLLDKHFGFILVFGSFVNSAQHTDSQLIL